MDLEPEQIRISPIPKTWILDLDGTLVIHDGPYFIGKDFREPSGRGLHSVPRQSDSPCRGTWPADLRGHGNRNTKEMTIAVHLLSCCHMSDFVVS